MKKTYSLYIDQKISLTTMHKKELYLNDACKKILGASLCASNEKIDTDLLGTFSGEIERTGNQKETVLKKCNLGLDLLELQLGIANEGSFGPHPHIPFISSSCETLVFVDRIRKLEIFESMIFTKTNYRHRTCSSNEDLTSFLQTCLFPSHGLIVRPNVWKDKKIVFKGIQDFIELEKSIRICCQNSIDQLAHVETDMRAHMNPTRGANIRKLGIRLFRRLTFLCPNCQSPGWGQISTKKGRPCAVCEYPSKLPKSSLWSCVHCSYQEEKFLPNTPNYATPEYCDMCNP